MAARRLGDLGTPGEVWVIDTSSVVQVRREQPLSKMRPAIFSALTDLVTAGKLVFPQEVYGELERGNGSLPVGAADDPFTWAEQNRQQATRHGTDFEVVRRVLAKVPNVLDADKTSGADEADPYVLGLALHLKEHGHEVTVVSEERKDRADKMSMNTACGLLRLYCVPLMGLLRDQEIFVPLEQPGQNESESQLRLFIHPERRDAARCFGSFTANGPPAARCPFSFVMNDAEQPASLFRSP